MSGCGQIGGCGKSACSTCEAKSPGTRREMFRGDSLIFTARIQTSQGAVFNLTGARILMTAKYSYSYADSEAVFQLSTDMGGGITVTSIPTGAIRVEVAPAKTYLMPDGKVDLVYDLKVIGADGVVTTVESGILTVKPSATRFTF